MTDDCKPKPLRISWTQLLRFEDCARSAQLMREGNREKGIVDQRNFLGGNCTDNAMRRWLESDNPEKTSPVPLGKTLLAEYIEKQGDQIRWKGSKAQDVKKVLVDIEEALTTLEPWLRENVLPYPYEPEARGTARMLVADVDGTLRCVDLFYAVDIAVKRPEGFKLYDLKTTRNDKYVEGKTLGQLTYYKLAWMVKFRLEPDDFAGLAFITPLTKNFLTEVYPENREIQVIANRIMRYAQAAWNGIAPTKTQVDSSCQYRCEVRNSCPLYKLPEVMNSGRIDFTKLIEAQKLLSDTTELDKLGMVNLEHDK